MKAVNDRWIGVACGLAAGVMFGAMYGAIRLLALRGCSPGGMALSRGVLGTLALLPFAVPGLRSIFSRAALSVWARSTAGAIALVLQFVGLQYAATAFVRSMTDLSVVISALLAALLYKERLQLSGWAGTVVVSGSVLGLSLLNYSAGAAPIVLGVTSAIATTAAFLALRRSSMKFSSPTVVWCLSIGLGLVASGDVIMTDGSFRDAIDWRVVAFVAVPGVLGQLLLTRAFALLPTALASSIGLSTLCFGLGFEWAMGTHVPSTVEGVLVCILLFGVVSIHYGRQPTNATHSNSIVSTPRSA